MVALGTNWRVVLSPVRTLLDPAVVLFRPENPWWSKGWWSEIAYAWSRLLWGLCVWSILGGALTRMCALQFARDESISVRSALRFSTNKFLSFLSAPLLAFAFVGFFWFLSLLGGLFASIPYVGETVIGLLWPVQLGLGFLMSLMLIGVALGWPLMLATIGVEGSDAFDGFSRSYSYIYDRPWYYAWCAIVALVYGSVVIFFVWAMTSLFVYLAGWSISSGMHVFDRDAGALMQTAPELLDGADVWGESDNGLRIGRRIVGFWLKLLTLLLVGFVSSYFWTASTIIYFLLRQSDDATELDQVYLPDEVEQDELTSIVGGDADRELPEAPPTTETNDGTQSDGAAVENGQSESSTSDDQ